MTGIRSGSDLAKAATQVGCISASYEQGKWHGRKAYTDGVLDMNRCSTRTLSFLDDTFATLPSFFSLRELPFVSILHIVFSVGSCTVQSQTLRIQPLDLCYEISVISRASAAVRERDPRAANAASCLLCNLECHARVSLTRPLQMSVCRAASGSILLRRESYPRPCQPYLNRAGGHQLGQSCLPFPVSPSTPTRNTIPIKTAH